MFETVDTSGLLRKLKDAFKVKFKSETKSQ